MSEPARGEADLAHVMPSSEPDDLPSDRLHRFLVEEVMTRTPISVDASSSLLAAAQAMRDNRVSGFPVVDPEARVIGVLSEKDIVRTLDAAAGLGRARGVLDLLLSASGRGRAALIETYLRCLERTRVGEAMTSRPVVVEAGAVLVEGAQLFRRHAVNRLPVVDGSGRLVGILARQDLIRAVAQPVPKRARSSDRALRHAPRRAARRAPTRSRVARSRAGAAPASRARGSP